MNILLIGPRASGKSAIGPELAARRQSVFVDLDDIVLAAFDEPTVEEIWAAHGDAAWREAEADAIEAVLHGQHQVIALGGGTPMIDSARTRIEEEQRAGRAKVVYLQCDVSELIRRLRDAPGDRPSLTGADPADEIARVLTEREPTCLAMADIVFDTTTGNPTDAADRLAAMLPGESPN